MADSVLQEKISLAAAKLYAYVKAREFMKNGRPEDLNIEIPGMGLEVTRARMRRRQLQNVHRDDDTVTELFRKTCSEASDRSLDLPLEGRRKAEALTFIVWRLGGNSSQWAKAVGFLIKWDTQTRALRVYSQRKPSHNVVVHGFTYKRTKQQHEGSHVSHVHRMVLVGNNPYDRHASVYCGCKSTTPKALADTSMMRSSLPVSCGITAQDNLHASGRRWRRL